MAGGRQPGAELHGGVGFADHCSRHAQPADQPARTHLQRGRAHRRRLQPALRQGLAGAGAVCFWPPQRMVPCTFGDFSTVISNPWRFVWTQTRTWALRAQARIALINTALTAAGMWALAIPGIGLLSLFVFICSFIPIAGCFISTVPIGFTALTEFGFVKVSALAQPGFPPANVLYVSTLPSLPADSHNASVACSYSHASASIANACAELWLAVLGSSRW